MMNYDVLLCCSKPRTVETSRQIDIGNSNREENAAIAIKRKSTSRIRAKNKRVRRKVPDDVKSIDTASNSDSLPKLELDKTKLSTSVESTRIETADPAGLGDFIGTELVEESRASLGNGQESWRHFGGQKHDRISMEASPEQLSDNITTAEILLQLKTELINSKHVFKCNFRSADPLQISLMAEKLTTRTIEDSLTEVLEEDTLLL